MARRQVVLPQPEGPNSAVMPRPGSCMSTIQRKAATLHLQAHFDGQGGGCRVCHAHDMAEEERRVRLRHSNTTNEEISTMPPASQWAWAYSSASTWS